MEINAKQYFSFWFEFEYLKLTQYSSVVKVLLSICVRDYIVRQSIAVTVRNNLVAALHNLAAVKMYISISLPYCDTEELTTLRTAATHIFKDTQSQASYTSYSGIKARTLLYCTVLNCTVLC